MPHGRGTVREIAWQEIFPWLLLLRTFRLAISFRLLLLAALALVAIVAGWRLIGLGFRGADDPVVHAWIAAQSAWPWNPGYAHYRAAHPPDRVAVWPDRLPVVGDWITAGPVAATWLYLSRPFRMLFSAEASVVGAAYALLCCLWAVLVVALLGGAATRIAALALARGEPLGLKGALQHARQKLAAYFAAPFMPLVGVLLVSLLLMLLGLLMRWEPGVVIAAVLWPLVLLAGLLIAILLIGLLVGWTLMWPTIATEETDAFDALSRSYAYVYQRPLRLVLYALVVSLLGLAGVVLVDLFTDAVVHFSRLGTSWGMGAERAAEVFAPYDYPEIVGADAEVVLTPGRPPLADPPAGARLIAFWLRLVQMMVVVFELAFFWAAATAIYLLLRRAVDGTDLDEVRGLPAEAVPLPPLEPDAQGVPGVKE